MSRKILRLTLDHLAASGAPCRSCLFWELDPVRRARVDAVDAAGEKEAWVSEVLREWGSCGRVALVDGEVRGLLLYAPPALVPGADAFPTSPASPDSVVLTDLWVHPGHRHGGLGRMLVQGMARDLISRGGIRAVEAFAAASPVAGSCLPPLGFLEGVGFRTHRPHPLVPRMRMELRSAVTWREEVEAALERLLGAVRPAPARGAAGRAHRGESVLGRSVRQRDDAPGA